MRESGTCLIPSAVRASGLHVFRLAIRGENALPLVRGTNARCYILLEYDLRTISQRFISDLLLPIAGISAINL